MKINIERLMNDISVYSEYGSISSKGITRPSFSNADYELRSHFIKELQQMGLEVTVDSIANIWGRYRKNAIKKPSICLGSHLDTVPNGGAYDGALGVLAAKEVIQTLIDNDIKLYHPLEIVSFTAEEANDFNLSTMGSRAFSGKLNRNTLLNATDSTGRTLKEAVKYVGSDVSQVSKTKKDIAAFIELHIEQGIRLEKANHSIGIVDSIVGIQQEKVTIYGEANHSGTTMMEDRADALVTASEIVIAIEAILQRSRTNAVATVGRFNV